MLDETARSALRSKMLVIRMVWFSILFSLLIYLIVANALKNPEFESQVQPMVQYALVGVGVIAAVAGQFVRRFLLQSAEGQPANTADDALELAAKKYMSAVIVSTAMAELLGILGLVIFVMSQNTALLYACLAGSALVVLMSAPKNEELEDLAEALSGQAF